MTVLGRWNALEVFSLEPKSLATVFSSVLCSKDSPSLEIVDHRYQITPRVLFTVQTLFNPPAVCYNRHSPDLWQLIRMIQFIISGTVAFAPLQSSPIVLSQEALYMTYIYVEPYKYFLSCMSPLTCGKTLHSSKSLEHCLVTKVLEFRYIAQPI